MGQWSLLVWLTTPNAVVWIWIAPKRIYKTSKKKQLQFETFVVSCSILGVVFINLGTTVDRWAVEAFHGLQDHVNPFQGHLVGEFHPGGQAPTNANPSHCTE